MQIVWLNVYSARLLTEKKCEPLLFACVQQASWPVRCGQQQRSLDHWPGNELMTFPGSWTTSKTMQNIWLIVYTRFRLKQGRVTKQRRLTRLLVSDELAHDASGPMGSVWYVVSALPLGSAEAVSLRALMRSSDAAV